MILRARVFILGIFIIVVWILACSIRFRNSQSEPALNRKLEDVIGYDIDLSQEGFIKAIIDSAGDDIFEYGYISEMCDGVEWDSKVIFTCHDVIGGIGNIRQELLHCIRFAIDAGAGFLLPEINLRSVDDLSDLESGTAGLDYLFDLDHAIFRLNTACPQMTIYKNIQEVQTLGSITETEVINVKELPHWPLFRVYSVRSKVQELRAPAREITLVPFERIWQHYPICNDPRGFADTFGNLLPFRADAHRLAAKILYNLYSQYHVPIDPDVPTTLPSADSFIGIHLRTANDILPYWYTYADQANYYLTRIESSNLLSSIPIIYIASGNATSITEFGIEAQSLSQSKQIVTKYDLVSGADRTELETLTWDQQALVDYLVLMRSAYFMGMADSSFAWNLAVLRRKTSEAGSCGWRMGWWKSLVMGASFRDEFSDLMGNRKYGWESRMWP